MPAFMERAPAELAASLRDHWITLWRARCPGSDPAHAWELIEPVAAARRATVYLGFLDCIEPAEHPYHGIDPRDHLHLTAEILTAK